MYFEWGASLHLPGRGHEIIDVNAPPEALQSGHETSEYFMIRDFVAAIENSTQPPIDVTRAVNFTLPGILAHKSAIYGSVGLMYHPSVDHVCSAAGWVIAHSALLGTPFIPPYLSSP